MRKKKYFAVYFTDSGSGVILRVSNNGELNGLLRIALENEYIQAEAIINNHVFEISVLEESPPMRFQVEVREWGAKFTTELIIGPACFYTARRWL